MHPSPMFRSIHACLLAAALAAVPVGTASADEDTTDSAPQPAPLLDENGNPFPPARPKPADFNAEITASRFAELAMADALMEMALGELVKERGASQSVKDLGHRLVTNHGAIKLILAKAAAASEVPVPVSLDAEQQAVLARLSALSGAELDREYLWEQTLRQPRTLQMYQWQYENCDDPRLKPFAMGTLPIVVVHARVCDEVHRKVNAEEIRIQDKRAAAERKAQQEREQAEAMAAAQKKASRKFKK
jgi:putative membrane protein